MSGWTELVRHPRTQEFMRVTMKTDRNGNADVAAIDGTPADWSDLPKLKCRRCGQQVGMWTTNDICGRCKR